MPHFCIEKSRTFGGHKITIERALNQLLAEGIIEKVGAGRGTGYVKIR